MSKDIQQQKQFKILLIGEACSDYFFYGVVDRISPEAPVPVFNVKDFKVYSGMAGNVKKNLEGLGVETYFVRNFEEIRKDRYVDSRFNQHVLRIDNEKEIQPFKMEYIPSDFFIPDAIIISDYNKGFLPSSVIVKLLEVLKKEYPDCGIFVDSKKPDLSCFTDCFIKLNEKEYEETKTTIKPSNKVIVTLGKRGAMFEEKIFKAKEVETFDVTGAGDTFLASFVFKYLETKNVSKSIVFANSCASFAVKKTGTYAITKRDIDDICL